MLTEERRVRVLCIGGTTRPNSASEKAVKASAGAAALRKAGLAEQLAVVGEA